MKKIIRRDDEIVVEENITDAKKHYKKKLIGN